MVAVPYAANAARGSAAAIRTASTKAKGFAYLFILFSFHSVILYHILPQKQETTSFLFYGFTPSLFGLCEGFAPPLLLLRLRRQKGDRHFKIYFPDAKKARFSRALRIRMIYLFEPRKNSASVPGPEWAPMTGPMSVIRAAWLPNSETIMDSSFFASSGQSPFEMK